MLAAWLAPAASAQLAPSARGDSTASSVHIEQRRTVAETQLARTEREKLERDNGWLARLLSYLAPLLTAVAAAAGVLISVWKVGSDRRDAVEREVRERDASREAAEIERFDERFAKAVEGLSSAKPGEESGAAVLVASMVREKRQELSDQALQLLLVALQTEHDEACERLLRYALERFARSAPQRLTATADHEAIGGLAHVRASYLDLANVDLPGLDIAYSVLRKADFRRAGLQRCRGLKARLEKARFDEADLTGAAWVKAQAPGASFQSASLDRANLHQADLSGANLYRASLRKANLRHATLAGTRFRSASLEKADFYGAEMDERTLESMLEAQDWRAAEFSRDTRAHLEELENQRKSGRQAL